MLRSDSAFESDFQDALARDFDTQPSNEFTGTMKMNHLEGIVSLVQQSLESDSGLSDAGRVMPVLSEQFDILKTVLSEFESCVKASPAECLTDEKLAPYFSNLGNPSSHANRVLFVLKKQQIRGFLMMTNDGSGSMQLERLFVRPAARRDGLGSQLVRRAIEMSAELDCSRVFMNPLHFNTASYEDDNTRGLKSLLSHEGFKSADQRGAVFQYVINPQRSPKTGHMWSPQNRPIESKPRR